MHTRLITWTNATNIDGGIEYLQTRPSRSFASRKATGA